MSCSPLWGKSSEAKEGDPHIQGHPPNSSLGLHPQHWTLGNAQQTQGPLSSLCGWDSGRSSMLASGHSRASQGLRWEEAPNKIAEGNKIAGPVGTQIAQQWMPGCLLRKKTVRCWPVNHSLPFLSSPPHSPPQHCFHGECHTHRPVPCALLLGGSFQGHTPAFKCM